MTSLFTVRRRAEEFASAVDADGETIRRVPGSSPQFTGQVRGQVRGQVTGQVAELVRVVTLLRAHESPVPRPEFTSELRSRLMTEAETVLHPESARLLLPHRPTGRRQRRLVAAASAAVLVGGTASMAAAAQEALPGELLYPVKRVIEKAEAEFSLSPAGKGRDLLGSATDRLTEVEGLLASDAVGSRPQVSDTLVDFNRQADAGAGLLLDSYTETRDPEAVVAVRTFAADAVATLETLAEDVPPESQDELAAAAVLLHELDERASELCGTCAPALPELEVPGILLARAEVDRALRSVSIGDLDNSHPVVVPKRVGSADDKSADKTKETAGDDAPATGGDESGPLPGGAVPDTEQPTGDDPTPGVDTDGLLPEVQLETEAPGGTDAGGGVGGGVGGAVEGATGLHQGAVETILPDSDGLLEDDGNLLP